MSESQKSIVSNTVAFQDITNTDLMKVIRNAHLIGFGESPHGVKEYFPIVRDVVRDLLGNGRRVLVLLEYEYWLNRLLDEDLHGKTDNFVGCTFRDPVAGVFYGVGLHQFYRDLRTLNGTFPDRLSCRHFDLFMNPLNDERSERVRAIDQRKWDISRSIRQLQKENKLDQFAAAREQFIFQESIEACRAFQPDVTVMLAGSFHVSKQGGCPFGNVFVKPVMTRLAEYINEKPVSVRFSVLGGEFARLDYRNKTLVKVSVNCDEWGQEDHQIELRNAIRELSGIAFITDLPNTIMPERLAESYTDWSKNYDYLVSVRHASPDLPLKQ